MIPLILGICGKSGAGKDTIAAHLRDRHGFARVAVADRLKRLTVLAFDFSDDQLWGSGRDLPDARFGLTPREIYQRMGDALRSIHPETLVRGWLADASVHLAAGVSVVCPDIRTPLEVAALRRAGGLLWRVRRGEGRLRGAAAAHLTETALDDLSDPDEDLDNDGSIEALLAAADEALRRARASV
ncbi:MAG: hypothetical protein U0359_19625 [Byssovorax sp.]